MTVSIEEFSKATKKLEEALSQKKNDFIRDAVIQRFEFCLELAWKTSKKIMGNSTTAPKQVIREMAQNGLIDDVVFWLRAIDEGNLSSYTYNEDLAEKVYSFVQLFLPYAKDLVKKLELK